MITKYNKTQKWLTSLSFVICHLSLSVSLTSCSDFFETDPGNIIKEDAYIADKDEMYKGMLGIFNRMQEAGDQAIWLTDTRCNYLETTTNAPDALKEIYSYEPTQDNEYADPSCYYAIVNCCNDYFSKMGAYLHNVGGLAARDSVNFRALISSAIRIKVWAYFTLGRIYGQAYWFDSPLTEMHALDNTDIFTRCDMQQLVDRCIDLLDRGLDIEGIHIDSNLDVDWSTWLDPDATNTSTTYNKWFYMTPPLVLLKAELLSWRCNYKTEDAAQADWTWIRDNLLDYMYNIHTGATVMKDITSNLGYTYQCNIPLASGNNHTGAVENYNSIFCSGDELGNVHQVASCIWYDYQNDQHNRIVQYLCPTYPDADSYYLRPSDYGLGLYNDEDVRSVAANMVAGMFSGKPAVTKYYYYYNPEGSVRNYQYKSSNIFDIEPSIIIYRGHDFHFLIAEAENHLGNWELANHILNNGLENAVVDRAGASEGTALPDGWSKKYASWFGGNGGYGNCGIVGAARGTTYDLPTDPATAGMTADQLKQRYDWALADEYLKEFVAEGKSYSYLCKMGDRYSHAGRGTEADARSAIANRIAPKYQAGAMQQKVKNFITSNGYFIQWDLKDGLTK